jgi:preprotein translocase subunit SecE
LGVRFPPGLPRKTWQQAIKEWTGVNQKHVAADDNGKMNSKAESGKPAIVNTLLLVLALALLLGGTAGYYYYQDVAIAPVRVVGLIVIAIIASFIAAQSEIGGAFFRFLKEADIERRKVVWPTHQETLQTALMVMVVTILISLFLAVVDWMLSAGIRSLVGG